MANRLASATSPYLRQHAGNPVDWYAWGPEAFAAAAEHNVPILLSVGYSACHWCHVMAHECFEDDEVAAAMNAGFVNIKVDREERPDIDSIYMDAVQAMTGRGGWPMTVFLTPQREPFYGGTYFPKPQFLQLMAAITDVWTNRPDDVRQNVGALMEALGRTSTAEPASGLPDTDLINQGLSAAVKNFDIEWGGFGAAPKFPSAMTLDLVMRASGDGPEQVLTTSLDAMASGGIYDHLGGGFARYSVDREWLVPHFEKMLYDQALLVRAYTRGWLLYRHDRWRQVVEETIGYVLRDLRHPEGGFYSAEDADSPDGQGHNHEGLFYTWTPEEVRSVLGADAGEALEWYEITGEPNFEGRWIPARLHHRGELIRPDAIESARQRLFEARLPRPRPGQDDKVLTEWNGLMLSSLAEAAAVFGRHDWRDAAVQTGEFLIDNLRAANGRWYRSWQADGTPQARHDALAGDHAALIDAFTRLAELTGQARWVDEAVATADVLLDHFFDVDQGGVFTSPDDGEALIVRQKDLLDNATPGANSLAALALYRLAALTGEQRFANQADRILQLLGGMIPRAPGGVSLALVAANVRQRGLVEVVIPGDRPDLRAVVTEEFRPEVVLAWGEPYDSPLWEGRDEGLAYVCRNYACQMPAGTAEELRAQL